MRPPDFSHGRLSAEWIDAIREEETRGANDGATSVPRDEPAGSDPPEVYEHSSELEILIEILKHRRIDRGLSLADIARVTQQARSAISRLENGRYTNPTLHTLYRYARALGLHIKLSAEPLCGDPKAGDQAGRDPRRTLP